MVLRLREHFRHLGRVNYHIDGLNNQQTLTYDAWGQIAGNVDEFGNTYKADYDLVAKKATTYLLANGSSIPDHLAETIKDRWGRVVQINAAGLSESYQWDIQGNLIQYTDPRNYSSNYDYDGLNRLIKATDAKGQAADYDYNLLGALSSTSINEESQSYTTTRTYDELGRLRQKTDPGGLSENYTVDAYGNVISRQDANQVNFTSYYDAYNRLYYTTDGNANIVYYYAGHPFGVDTIYPTNESVVVGYQYDSTGRVAAINQFSDGYNNIINNQYSRIGQLNSVQDPYGATTAYQYDQTRVSGVTLNNNSIAAYEYYPDGQIHYITYPTLSDGSILKTEFNYDSLNRLTNIINHKGSQIISQFNYVYDNNGNITSITDARGTTSYQYDELNRLIQISRPNASTINYQYDARGNRISQEGVITTPDEGEVNYSYNVWNRLTQSTKGTNTVNYQYDPNGLRIKKITPTETIRYIYNGNGKVIAEADASNQVIATYIWGPDRLLAKQETNGAKYYYIYNGHGDVIQIVDSAGNMVNSYEYDEWGNILNQTETIANEFKYAGEIYDSETGFYYLRARYYDPATGRFISKDSVEGQIDNPLSLNLYTYVENNPLIYVDPTGHYMQGDENLGLSTKDQAKIDAYGKQWMDAYKANDITGMQTAHNAATAIRMNYSTAVSHIEYSIGKTNTLCSGKALVDNSILSPPDLATNLIPGKAAVGFGVAGIRVSSKAGKIVIGENMADRVFPYAKEIGAQYYKPRSTIPENWMKNNKRRLQKQIKAGKKIIDIGPDPLRKIRSEYNEMES